MRRASVLLVLLSVLLIIINISFSSSSAYAIAAGTAKPTAGVNQATPPVYYTNGFVILNYHSIAEDESTYTISPEHFTEQLTTLKKLGYNFVSLDTAAQFMEGKRALPANALVITFDDGVDSFYRCAYPILKSNDIPATIFAIVSYVGKGSEISQYLSWDNMREMQRTGYFTFYSHTYSNHRYVTVDDKGTTLPALMARIYRGNGERETLGQYEKRIFSDLLKSRVVIENQLKHPVRYLALPYGASNWVSTNAAVAAGFKYILSMRPGLNTRSTPSTKLCRFDAGNVQKSGPAVHNEVTTWIKRNSPQNIPMTSPLRQPVAK